MKYPESNQLVEFFFFLLRWIPKPSTHNKTRKNSNNSVIKTFELKFGLILHFTAQHFCSFQLYSEFYQNKQVEVMIHDLCLHPAAGLNRFITERILMMMTNNNYEFKTLVNHRNNRCTTETRKVYVGQKAYCLLFNLGL